MRTCGKKTRKTVFGVIIGILLLAGFVWYALDSFTGRRMTPEESPWTIILIVVGLLGLFCKRGKLGSLGVMLFGAALLVRDNGWFPPFVKEEVSVWQIILAEVLLLAGLGFIGGALGVGKKKKAWKANVVCDGVTEECGGEANAIFSSQRIDYSGREFSGIELNGVFGTVELDLRTAIIPRSCTIQANSVFGGVEILVGTNANYETESSKVFGSVANRTSPVHNDQLPTVTIEANSVFGGVEIKY